MTPATALIPGLDGIVRHRDAERCLEATRRIADLFFEDVNRLRPEHINLFDGLLIDLLPFADVSTRVDLAERLSHLVKAPRVVIGQLARDDEVAVAGPLLRRSSALDDAALIDVALSKGQGHLLAMAERPVLSVDMTDVLVRRGDRDVVRRTAANAGAAFSERGYSDLVNRAGFDGVLTLAVGKRNDLSDEHLKQLLAGSLDVVRRRLFDVVRPEKRARIRQAMAELADVAGTTVSKRNFVPAQRAILSLYEAGALDEAALLGFASEHKYEEVVAALAAMTGLKIATLDRLVSGDRHDPLLILGRTIGLDWRTVQALILLRLGPKRVPAQRDIEALRVNYARLLSSTAERVVAFWKTRH
ncbi:hypothetical protein SSBR45G_26670 [Bradyrhizobium sp. SSBR45G]|uniref:DUF2336 domain-containing protein n=1 Tax=unclassified Bradyrhizobium TaxID=2631580 RepID=UPI0023428EE9|nr:MULTISPECIES: DUF2336 domain-containing protein [unclassified Bradyrhizobium]GLH77759.1 hypothetical protein SSBR45G_26670 [Bradyrhizobium sp. SSBR45G]GLH84996.1 hypothetical protein SSBR45R_24560 [Bradyrhizobium sp. SSBR45R]